jgi:hypothetical protein
VATLSPALFVDGDTFHAPTVAGGGQVLTPTLFADDDTFYTPSVAAVTLTQADLDSIAAAVWASDTAVAAHAKLDAILARLTC